MITVRTLSKDDWARYALLVIYAWDMCDLNQDPASNDLDPRILADGWKAVGVHPVLHRGAVVAGGDRRRPRADVRAAVRKRAEAPA